MTAFADAGIVFAGGSADVGRDFIVRAGSSIPENRDYIVVLKRRYRLLGGVVSISSGLLTISDFNRIEALPGVVEVSSAAAGLTLYSSLLISAQPSVIQVGSSGLTFLRFVEHLTSTIQVLSGTADLVGPPSTELGVLALQLASGTAALTPFTAEVMTTEVGSIEVSSGQLTLGESTQVGSMELETSVISIDSGDVAFSYQYLAELETSIIELRSSNARFFNPHLVGRNSVIRLVSAFADLRLLQTGYLPSTAPTTRSFQPPSYKIEKTAVLAGRTVRQVMCSKPSDALLTLEYINVSDAFAEEVLTAYDQSYGTRYGFALPPEVVTGAGTDLLNYISLNGSSLKWFYATTPSVESISPGICNLNVQLKAKVEAT